MDWKAGSRNLPLGQGFWVAKEGVKLLGPHADLGGELAFVGLGMDLVTSLPLFVGYCLPGTSWWSTG